MTAKPDNTPEEQEKQAFRHVRKLRGFYVHLFQYVMVVGFLTVINVAFSPGTPWVLWVIAGWGLGILSHAFAVFRPSWGLGPQWERAQVEKRLGRSL